MGPLKIDEIWAFIALDPADSTEGIIAVKAPGTNMMMPLVGADRQRIESYRRFAQQAADQSGRRVMLKRFSTVTVEETICPHSHV